jgi:sulfatase modifying factor 1
MKRAFLVLALLYLGSIARANVFDLGPGLTNLETVRVGNAGNAADTQVMYDGTTGYGSVSYNYNIGKYEVTAAQYTEFLNAKAKTGQYALYNFRMSSTEGCHIVQSGTPGSYTYSVAADWANRPVDCISYWDACRFVNWLGNGQGNADTETGTYTLNGYNGTDGHLIARNVGSKWAIASENEWYKAAYYDPDKVGGAGYWDYATRSDIAPANQVQNPDPGNSANYEITYWPRSPGGATNVGEFENSASAYGTFDQAGNVSEVLETIPHPGLHPNRYTRGGSLADSASNLRASSRFVYPDPTIEGPGLGFRVVCLPEPSSLLALFCGVAGLGGVVRRRARGA